MPVPLSDDQVTAAALAAVLKYPEWSRGICYMTHDEIRNVAFPLRNELWVTLGGINRDGVAFMRWLQTELLHKLTASDIRRILLTIKYSYYRKK